MRKPIGTTLLWIAVLAVTGCGHVEPGARHEAQGADVHFGYTGEIGPSHWGRLRPEYALCGTGKSQSPIDVSAPVPANASALGLNYQPTALHIVNNGHAIQVNYDAGSWIEVDGVAYSLKQFHFHSPSEHTWEGRHLPLEMHLVHQSDAGALAVLAVMYERGAKNDALAPVWTNLRIETGQEYNAPTVLINVGEILPDTGTYYEYEGSLTTPPCTQGVKWFILASPGQVSEAQIATLRSIIKDNNRPTQPLHKRKVLKRSE